MIKFISVLILNFTFLIVNCFSQSWYIIDPVTIAGTPDLSDVFFTDENTGWISSSSQANIFMTNDGGASFSTQITNFSTNAINFLDANNGYSCGASGFVYKTTDGGDNWPAIGGIGVTLTDLDFATISQGYACGNGGAVFSISGGVTNLNSPSSSDFGGISAPSVNNVWVCGGGSIFYYNGSTFDGQSGPGGIFNDIHFINNQEGWVVGNQGVIGRTKDGGAGWTTQTNPDTQNRSLYGVFFFDSNNGWAVGIGGIILHTINGGTTWIEEGQGLTTAFLRGVHFTSTSNGYVIGNGKTLLKYGMPLATEDKNGILENAVIFLPNSTNDTGIAQECLSWLYAPNQVGTSISTMPADKTVLHTNSPVGGGEKQPADYLLESIALNYKELTPIDEILGKGNLK